MNEAWKKGDLRTLKRRSFFGKLIAGVIGGYLGGGMLRSAPKVSGNRPDPKKAIRISANPLAIPRSKEGSRSNA